MVYRVLVPDQHDLASWPTRDITAPILHLNNRLITEGYHTTLYETCRFNFIIDPYSLSYPSNPRKDHATWAAVFHCQIGEDALRIKHFRICLPMFGIGYPSYTPSKLPIIDAFNRYCNLKVLPVDEASPCSISDDLDDPLLRFTFKAQTTKPSSRSR